jgi:hypothetical protein
MKPVVGFEELYNVDEHGNIYSLPKNIPVGNSGGVRKQAFKKLNLYQTKSRHLRVYLAKDGKKYPRLVHRLVAQAFIPNPNNEPIINHIDSDPANNHISNLEWCSHQHNSIHAYENGLNKPPLQSGSKNSNAKLTDIDVLKMRDLFLSGSSIVNVASMFSVGYSCAWSIVKNRTWKHLL